MMGGGSSQFFGGDSQKNFIKIDKQLSSSIKISPFDPLINHFSTSDNKLPLNSNPNSSIDRVDENGNVIQRRFYDELGRAIRDVDFTDHGNSKLHPIVPHEHIWDWSNPERPKRI